MSFDDVLGCLNVSKAIFMAFIPGLAPSHSSYRSIRQILNVYEYIMNVVPFQFCTHNVHFDMRNVVLPAKPKSNVMGQLTDFDSISKMNYFHLICKFFIASTGPGPWSRCQNKTSIRVSTTVTRNHRSPLKYGVFHLSNRIKISCRYERHRLATGPVKILFKLIRLHDHQ